jgi:hypothetical protein
VKFSKLLVVTLIFVLLLSQITGCSTPSSSTTTQPFLIPDNFTTYTDENSLYTIAYPNQWEPMSEAELTAMYSQAKDTINSIKSGLPVEKASMIFAAGLKTSTGYYPSAVIVVEPAPALVLNNNLAVQAEINGLKQMDPNYQEISRTKLTANGKDETIVEYKGHFTSSNTLMHNIVLISLSGKTIWTITCSATDADFTLFSDDYNNSLRSFQLTK